MADKVVTFAKQDLNGYTRCVVPCAGYSSATFQFVPTTGVSTVVWTLKRSNDGINWAALATAQTLGPSSSISSVLSIGTAYLCAEVTTLEGSTDYGDIIVCLKE